MTPEGRVKKKIKAVLEQLEIPYCMPFTGGYGKSGVADFICCVGGKYVEIEAKAPGKNLTELQKRRQRDVVAGGGLFLIYDDLNCFDLKYTLECLKS